MSSLKDIVRLLEKATIAGGVSDQVIHAAEERLGVRFPPSYRQFLSRYGALFTEGSELSGLFEYICEEEPPLWSDVVTETLQMRQGPGGRAFDEYVAISSDGMDYMFYLDTSRTNEKDECPVIVLGPGADGVDVAEDLFDFVRRSCEGTLAF